MSSNELYMSDTHLSPMKASLPVQQLEAAGDLARGRVHSLIRRELARAGLTQSDLARLLGVNKSVVSRMLARPSNLTLENAGRILRVLGFWFKADAEPVEDRRHELNVVKTTASGLKYRLIDDGSQKIPVIVVSMSGVPALREPIELGASQTRAVQYDREQVWVPALRVHQVFEGA